MIDLQLDLGSEPTNRLLLESTTRTPLAFSHSVPPLSIAGTVNELAIDYHRKRLHEPNASESLVEASRPASQDVDFAVNEALRVLPDVDRDVFLMREIAGLGYDEIASACGLTPDAVRSRIHRARLELRRQLAAPVATRRTTPMRWSGEAIRERT